MPARVLSRIRGADQNIQAANAACEAFSMTGTNETTLSDAVKRFDPKISMLAFNGARVGSESGYAGRDGATSVAFSGDQAVAATRTWSASGTVTTPEWNVRGYVVQFPRRIVKSVQQGSITLGAGSGSGTFTLPTPLTDLRNVALNYEGVDSTTSSTGTFARADVTDVNTITATRTGTSGSTTIYFTVIEFKPSYIKSIQRISDSLATGVASKNVSGFSAVKPENTLTLPGGSHWDTSFSAWNESAVMGYLASDGSAFTIERGASSATITSYYACSVIEFVPGIISVQRDRTTVTTPASNTSAVNAVKQENSFVSFLGYSTLASGGTEGLTYGTVEHTSEAVMTATRGLANASGSTYSWELATWLHRRG